MSWSNCSQQPSPPAAPSLPPPGRAGEGRGRAKGENSQVEIKTVQYVKEHPMRCEERELHPNQIQHTQLELAAVRRRRRLCSRTQRVPRSHCWVRRWAGLPWLDRLGQTPDPSAPAGDLSPGCPHHTGAAA